MRFRWRSFALIIIIGVSLVPAARAYTGDGCNEKAKQNPIFQAMETCQQLRAATQPTEISRLTKVLDQTGYCTTFGDSEPTDPALRQLCQDPAGAACQFDGKILNSRCEINFRGPTDLGSTTAYYQDECRMADAVKKLFDAHRGECDSSEKTPKDCDDSLRVKYVKQLVQIERDAIYTPDRIKQMTDLFARVKTMEISLVRATPNIPTEKKALLIKNLSATELALPKANSEDMDCFNSKAGKPSADIYNDVDPESGKPPRIYFCAGAVSMLSVINIYDLIHTLSHELSHSIDPCTLEDTAVHEGHGDAKFAENTYPGLISCLRGGTGPDSCTDSVLHCNVDGGIQLECQDNVDVQKCIQDKKQIPHCPLGEVDVVPGDLSKPQAYPFQVDQIQESFADFMGAEVTARIMQQDKAQGVLNQAGQLDALRALSADYILLHGSCEDTATNDEHPLGRIRVDRTMLGSKNFREAMCYPGAPPPTPAWASTTCKGL